MYVFLSRDQLRPSLFPRFYFRSPIYPDVQKVFQQYFKESMMFKVFMFLGLACLTFSQKTGTEISSQDPQRAYEYGYQLDDTGGSHGHVEKRDESGRVEGEYSINLGDGRIRVVKYVADENGYRADVSTDELGTESKNPNDVYIGSTAISGYEAALKYGPFAPPHIEKPLEPAPRPEVPRSSATGTINAQVNLPTYGTFASYG